METTVTPTAAPCAACGSTRGDRRQRRLCEMCYTRERRAGRLDRWPRLQRDGPTLTARTCASCTATFHDPAGHRRTYCSRRCYRAYCRDGNLVIPTGIITPAMLGITADQPPTDPDLTPRKVWGIGNLNARRALQWLTAHTGIEETQALARVVWMPAQPDAAARRAA